MPSSNTENQLYFSVIDPINFKIGCSGYTFLYTYTLLLPSKVSYCPFFPRQNEWMYFLYRPFQNDAGFEFYIVVSRTQVVLIIRELSPETQTRTSNVEIGPRAPERGNF